MYLFFDTETTGLPLNWQAPLEDLNNWPRLVQLAWLLTDEKGKEINRQNLIIKPKGFEIPEAAFAVHGISTERAQREGIALNFALTQFAESIKISKILVAHNMNYDEMIMGAEFLRERFKNELFNRLKVCTMIGSIDFCKIENSRGYKWPKLIELHEKLFGFGFEGAHDALADVRACSRCFFELRKRRII